MSYKICMMKYDLLARYFGANYRCYSGRSGNKLDMLKAFWYCCVYLLLFFTSYKRMLYLCVVETPDYYLYMVLDSVFRHVVWSLW